jgi:hypothetical protein
LMKRGAFLCRLPERSGGHPPALLSAPTARLRALLAVILRVLRALVATGLADLGTQLAQLLGEVAAACHVACRKPAHRGAIHVECDAARHHLDVGLLQASGRAVVTCIGAGVAGIDAGLVNLMGHEELLKME